LLSQLWPVSSQKCEAYLEKLIPIDDLFNDKLAEALVSNPCLKCIDLSTNLITDEGAKKLITAMEKNEYVKVTGLDTCSGVKEPTLKKIESLLANRAPSRNEKSAKKVETTLKTTTPAVTSTTTSSNSNSNMTSSSKAEVTTTTSAPSLKRSNPNFPVDFDYEKAPCPASAKSLNDKKLVKEWRKKIYGREGYDPSFFQRLEEYFKKKYAIILPEDVLFGISDPKKREFAINYWVIPGGTGMLSQSISDILGAFDPMRWNQDCLEAMQGLGAIEIQLDVLDTPPGEMAEKILVAKDEDTLIFRCRMAYNGEDKHINYGNGGDGSKWLQKQIENCL